MNINRSRTSTRNSNPRNGRISKLTVHHAAGILNSDNLLGWGHNPSNQGSWNYGIGSDANIHQLVPDNHRAWTSSSATNDHQALTIEVGNSATAPTWAVSDNVWETLINLCVHLCRQNPNIKQRNGQSGLWFDNTPNGSLTFHDMFTATTCPGPFIRARANQLCAEVNCILGTGTATTPSTPPPAPAIGVDELARQVIAGRWGNGTERTRRLTEAGHNASAVQARVNELLNGSTSTTPPRPQTSNLDEIARQVIRGTWGNGAERVRRLTAAGHDATAVQRRVNELLR
jgi:hypothetical protein